MKLTDAEPEASPRGPMPALPSSLISLSGSSRANCYRVATCSSLHCHISGDVAVSVEAQQHSSAARMHDVPASQTAHAEGQQHPIKLYLVVWDGCSFSGPARISSIISAFMATSDGR